LTSVNNLLENLDGTAENVAEGVAEGGTASAVVGGVNVGQLLQSSRQAIESSRQAVGLGNADDDDEDDDEYYDDDEDEESYDEEEGYSDDYDEISADGDEDAVDVQVSSAAPESTADEEIVEEEVIVEEELINDSEHVTSTVDDTESEVAGITSSTRDRLRVLQPSKYHHHDNRSDDEDAISIEGRRSTGTVSELSFSEADLAGADDDAKAVIGGAPPSRSSRVSARISELQTVASQQEFSSQSSRSSMNDLSQKTQPAASQITKTANEQESTPPQSNVGLQNAPVGEKVNVDKLSTTNPKTDVKKPQTVPLHPVSAPPPRVVTAATRSKGRPTTATSPASANSGVANTSLNKKIQSLQAQLTKSQKELTAALNQNAKLAKQIQTSEAEIEAQAKELHRAGEQLAENRTKAQEEQDDLLDEHEEEIEELEKKHQEEVDTLRAEYENTIAEWKNRYELEQKKRQQEGGDWTQELEDAIQREKDALKRLHDVTREKTELQSKFDKVTMHDSSLQEQLQAALSASKTASEREQKAQEELDAATNLHARQMAQRQRREAELEQTVLELGSALTLAKQQQQQSQSSGQASASADGSQQGSNVSLTQLKQEHNAEVSRLKERSEVLSEELETAHVSLTMEMQRRDALQQELADISREREEETMETQRLQQNYDRKVADLESTISRLQSTIRKQELNAGSDHSRMGDSNTEENSSMKQMKIQYDESKREIARLSEQLLRNQDVVESSKTEILALKGRLHSATTRAEEAENALYSSTNTTSTGGGLADIESGSSKRSQQFSMRRRVKGGLRGGGGMRPGSVRSIRSALQLGPGRGLNPAMEQIAQTIDSIDSWMIDTGTVLRYEPLARLGLFLYLVTLHLWSFALVVFHTTEVPHGDFGSMDSNPQHWRAHT